MKKTFTNVWKSIRLIMKVLSAVVFTLVFSAVLVLASNTHAQKIEQIKITVDFQNISLDDALTKIKSLTSLGLVYNNNLDLHKKVTLTARDISVAEVLTKLLKGTDFTFKQEGQNVLFIKIPPPVFKAAGGQIRGKIYDAQTNEALVGANVQLEGTTMGASADIEGKFILRNVPTGTYSLVVSFIGYRSRKIENIDVTEGNASEVDIPLTPSAENLSEVEIVAEMDVKYAPIINSNEISMLSEIRTSSLIVTGISNQQISRSLDRDAGDVVRRIPGVSVLDNFVLIRGMDPRYNLTMLNGMITPSSEMDTRAFSYNLVPTGVIDRIMAYKTPAPELLGNFGGGVIKVYTKNTNVARRIQIGISGQYRTGGSSFSDYTTYNGSSKDWYGGGVKQRQFPALLRDPNYKLPDPAQYPGEITALANQLPRVRTPKTAHHNFDKRFNVNYYDSWKLGSVRLNNLTSVNYTQERQFTKTTRKYDDGRYTIESTGEYTKLPGNSSYTDSLYADRVRISVMENLSLNINKNNHVELTSFFNRNAKDEVLIRRGNPDSGAPSFEEKLFSYRYNNRDLFQAQLSGTHTINTHTIEWSAGLNKANDNTPDMQRYSFTTAPYNQWEFILASQNNARITFETEEDASVYQLNYTKAFPEDLKLMAGGYYEQRDRDFKSFRYLADRGPEYNSNVPLSGTDPWNNVIATVYSDYFLPDGSGLVLRSFPGAGAYSFDDEIRAGYMAIDVPLFQKRLNIHGGVRYEWNERLLYDENGNTVDSVSIGLVNGVLTYIKTPDKIQDFILPSVNIGYKVTDKYFLRLAYGKTIDRPQYREQSNFSYMDFENAQIVDGNPLLKNAEIQNFDLRVEHYPSPSEFLAVGLFYKKLTNAIERVDVSYSSFVFPQIKFLNTKEATVYGLEAEARKNLAFVSPLLSNFSIIFNGALLESKVDFSMVVGGSTELHDRPLQGTSPYLVNCGLYYDNDSTGTKISVLYNIAGPRLRVAPNTYLGGLYERERHGIDVTFSQRINHFLEVKAGVQNLLDAPYRFFRDENLNGKFNSGDSHPRSTGGDTARGDYTEIKYHDGAYYSLGVNMTF